MKIAVSTSSFCVIDKAPLDLLKKKGCKVVLNPYKRKLTEKEIINFLDNVDGLIAGLEPLNENVFKKTKKLKAISRVGIGLDNIDLYSARSSGIKVSNTPDGPTKAVAELTIGACINLARNIGKASDSLHNKNWIKYLGPGIIGSKVLIIGYGRIGKEVSRLFKAFDADIFIYDPNISKLDLKYNEKLVGFDEGLGLADIITLHADANKQIISFKHFDLMKEGVIILNSSRGALINEDALIKFIKNKKVSSAWLDVFEKEPYNGELTQFSQVLLTPHMSTYSEKCRKDMEMMAVKNLLNDLGLEL